MQLDLVSPVDLVKRLLLLVHQLCLHSILGLGSEGLPTGKSRLLHVSEELGVLLYP